jgi:hypothetical protein
MNPVTVSPERGGLKTARPKSLQAIGYHRQEVSTSPLAILTPALSPNEPIDKLCELLLIVKEQIAFWIWRLVLAGTIIQQERFVFG